MLSSVQMCHQSATTSLQPNPASQGKVRKGNRHGEGNSSYTVPQAQSWVTVPESESHPLHWANESSDFAGPQVHDS